MTETFELHGEFTSDQVPDVRRFIERILNWIQDPDVSSRVSLATHELFENAIKFSDDGKASLHIQVTRSPEVSVRIVTRNRARPEHVQMLHQIAGKLGEATDLMAFYLSTIKQSPSTRGGLGIGRVAAEAEMRVSMQFEENVVIVNAELGESAF